MSTAAESSQRWPRTSLLRHFRARQARSCHRGHERRSLDGKTTRRGERNLHCCLEVAFAHEGFLTDWVDSGRESSAPSIASSTAPALLSGWLEVSAPKTAATATPRPVSGMRRPKSRVAWSLPSLLVGGVKR